MDGLHGVGVIYPTCEVDSEGNIGDWEPESRIKAAELGERLAACYHACEGINPEAVPKMIEALEKFQSCDAYDPISVEIAQDAARAALAGKEQS